MLLAVHLRMIQSRIYNIQCMRVGRVMLLTAFLRASHVIRVDESCHAFGMSRVTHLSERWYAYESYVVQATGERAREREREREREERQSERRGSRERERESKREREGEERESERRGLGAKDRERGMSVYVYVFGKCSCDMTYSYR